MVIITGKGKDLARRFYAGFIDYFIIFTVVAIYVFMVGNNDQFGTYRVTGLRALFVPVAWFLYFPVTESLFGQTLGKKAFHLHVVDSKGENPTIVQAFLRRLLDFAELLTFGVMALLTINHSEKNQRLGDMMARTTVIRTDAICRFCGTELELTTKEVIRGSFLCPDCNQAN